MNKDKLFDQHFRHELKYHASATPDHLWEKIDARRSFRHKVFNQFRLRWPAFAFTGITVFAVILFFNNTHELQSFKIVNASNNNSEIKNNLKIESPQASQKILASNSLASNSDAETTSVVKNKNLTSQYINQTSANDKKQENITKLKVTNPSNKTSLTSLMENDKTISNEFSIKRSALKTSAAQTFDNNNVEKTISLLEPKLEEFTSKGLPSANKNTQKNNKNTNIDNTGLSIYSVMNTKNVLLESERKISEKIKFPDPGSCPSWAPKGVLHFHFDLFGSLNLAMRTIKAKNQENNDFAKIRSSTETPNYAASSGFRISAVLGNGIAFRSGLNYTQINEIFDYTDEEEKTTVINVVVDTIILPDNTIAYIWDTLSIVETGTRHITSHNRYRMVDIPLILGYEIETDNFVFNLNGGAYFNILFAQKGQFLAPDQTPVSFTSQEENAYIAYKKRLNVSFYGSIGINYKLTENLQILFEPHARFFPKSFTRNDYLLDQNYVLVGILSGLRFTF